MAAELRKRAEEPLPQEGAAAGSNRDRNVQRLVELTDQDYNEMLEVRGPARPRLARPVRHPRCGAARCFETRASRAPRFGVAFACSGRRSAAA